MIPQAYITEWRAVAPWVEDYHVEQDLVICRALVEMFSSEHICRSLAFRGGTALYKLYLQPAARYSEDIDLVQIKAGPIGPVITALRETLEPWLGRAQWKQSEGRVTLVFRFAAEVSSTPLRLKVEINSREHFSVFGLIESPFQVESRWFNGHALLPTFSLSELLGTKLRALYQRRKGRDLFDLNLALDSYDANAYEIVAAFQAYIENEGLSITRAQFEKNLTEKLLSPQFTADIQPLLAHGHFWDVEAAAERVLTDLLSLLPGNALKSE